MMDALWLHLLQSTLFAALMVALYVCLPPRAAAIRYALLLAAVVKFAIPLALLVDAGWRLASHQTVIPARLPVLPAEFYSALTASPGLPQATHSSAVPLFLGAFWLLGAVVLLLLWASRLHNSSNGANEITAIEQTDLGGLAQRLPVRKNIRVCQSTAPNLCLQGIWRPVIRVPKSVLSDLTIEERDAVLLHELAHVYRRDNFWGAATHVVVCLFWFHPLLWWLEQRLLAERERAVDQMVVHCGVNRNAYVAGILKLCRHQLRPAIAGTSGVSGSDLKQRLEWIMSCPKRKFNFRAARTLMTGASTLFLALPLVIGFAQHLSGTPANDSKACRAGASYPEGTAMKMGSVVRECSQGSWVPTNKPATVVMKEPPPFTCQPVPSQQADRCACQGHGLFSLGAVVQGPGERLRCDSFTLGRFDAWRPLTPAELAFRSK